MNDVPKNDLRVVSDYSLVSKTLTYSLFLVVPLLIAYQIALPVINAGQDVWNINGVDALFQNASTLFGILPKSAGFPILMFLLIYSGIIARRYEARKYGFIVIDPSFFIRTITTAFLYSIAVNPISAFFSSGHIALPFPQGLGAIPNLHDILLLASLHAGAGFFEELLCRVILLGSILWVAKKVTGLHFTSRIIAVIVSALLFAILHYLGGFGMLADPFTPSSFLYRFSLGIIYGAIYIKKGYATSAWTHMFANVLVATNIF